MSLDLDDVKDLKELGLFYGAKDGIRLEQKVDDLKDDVGFIRANISSFTLREKVMDYVKQNPFKSFGILTGSVAAITGSGGLIGYIMGLL